MQILQTTPPAILGFDMLWLYLPWKCDLDLKMVKALCPVGSV